MNNNDLYLDSIKLKSKDVSRRSFWRFTNKGFLVYVIFMYGLFINTFIWSLPDDFLLNFLELPLGITGIIIYRVTITLTTIIAFQLSCGIIRRLHDEV